MLRIESLLFSLLGCALCVAVPVSVHAQDEPATDTPGPTGSLEVSADAALGLQRLGGGTLASIEGRLWLEFPGGWRLGVGGARGMNRISGGVLESSGLEATFGMGAATVGVPVPTLFGVDGLEATVTLGSGAVSLENALLGTTLDRETVWVVQPGLLWNVRALGPVVAGIEAGYRLIFGAEGLSRLEAADLRTPTVSLVFSLPPT